MVIRHINIAFVPCPELSTIAPLSFTTPVGTPTAPR